MNVRLASLTCLLCVVWGAGLSHIASAQPFAIEVVDAVTGRGVPLIELCTTAGVSLFTDSAGVVAFDEPGWMNQRVWFEVRGHGYEHDPDGFGLRGRSLDVTPGGQAKLSVKRRNIAERLYRVTGSGIYRDSLLVGRQPPLREPLLNARLVGCDSVVNAVFQGRLFWFWGDSNRPAYPLGNFQVTGATSRLPSDGGLLPEIGVDLDYFLPSPPSGERDNFVKSVCQMPGDGPTWINGLVVIKDADGRERLFAAYEKVKPPLTIYRRGICEWNVEQQEFERVLDYAPDVPLFPFGHPFPHRDGETDYLYFGDPFPLVRVPATVDNFLRLDRYEAFTCLKPGSRLGQSELDRDADGRLRYAWKRATPAVGAAEQAKLTSAGLLKPEEALLRLRDRATGKPVLPHRGSVCWNAYRGRWIAIFLQQFGTSPLGEVWYAESATPQGPWTDCVKIVTHDKYSFYNPKQHPYFDQQGGRVIYFEGTYTHTFAGQEVKTPRYDYNQIMYRLDLSDPRLRDKQ